jgi:two-component system sensor histidine kinase YesM
MRFPNFLDFKVTVDESLKSALLPPVLFQPFVENAIIHGFLIRNQRFLVRIDVENDSEQPGSGIAIRISDNGTGFTEEQLGTFDSGQFKQDHEHLGIGNVYERLRMNYGERAKLLFGNRPEGGAEVVLRLPFQTESHLR